MVRTLRTELLDTLPHDNPDALGSRRDLVLINRLMGNWRWLHRVLRRHVAAGDRILELGAGGGEFARWLIGEVRPNGGFDLTGLDLAPRPAGWPMAAAWIRHDLRTFPGYRAFDVVVANLTLHHFSTVDLQQLGQYLRTGPRAVLVCEPARRRLHLWQAQFLRFLGVNHVTRHDAPISVRAGFRGGELADHLGFRAPAWQVFAHETWRGAYRMVALKHIQS